MKVEDLATRAYELISKGEAVLTTRHRTEGVGGEWVDLGKFADFRTAARAFLGRTFGEHSPYFKDFESGVVTSRSDSVIVGIGILAASREDLLGGWLTTTKGLLSADIFSDFLEMAEHLLSEDYKDAAAVIIGSVLEGHLRQLAQKHGIEVVTEQAGRQVPKKADSLNAELTKAEAYNKLDQKSVTAWLDLRNKAAHGKYDEYTKSQVEQMCQAVLDFMVRNAI